MINNNISIANLACMNAAYNGNDGGSENEVILHDESLLAGVGASGIDIPKYNTVQSYIKKVNSFPMLTFDEEKTLCNRFYNDGNNEAGNKIFLAHLRLVVKMAFAFKKHFDNVQELIAEGNLGLLKALKKFDVTKNVRFATYAMLWIRASIQDYIFKNKSVVTIATSNSEKNVIYNISKASKAMKDGKTFNGSKKTELTPQQNDSIYKEFELTTKQNNSLEGVFKLSDAKIQDIYTRSKYGHYSIDDGLDLNPSNIEENSFSEIYSPEFYHKASVNKKNASSSLINAMHALNEREKKVIEGRFLGDKKLTLSQIAVEVGVSVERVRQIEALALKKMRNISQLCTKGLL
jgi:RNA polymerase sigma-32 factor